MCGIAGLLSVSHVITNDTLRCMGDAIAHRGPDGSGLWLNQEHGVGLVHRRLAILDLSEAGKQPMSSESGRYVICFNGEIYNFLQLRIVLARETGKTHYHGN